MNEFLIFYVIPVADISLVGIPIYVHTLTIDILSSRKLDTYSRMYGGFSSFAMPSTIIYNNQPTSLALRLYTWQLQLQLASAVISHTNLTFTV
jgi:hypothetical protein